VLSKCSVPSAMPEGARRSVPLKMTSVISLPRRLVGRPSPRIHLTESMTFDLPQPFGPTTAVKPRSNVDSGTVRERFEALDNELLEPTSFSPSFRTPRHPDPEPGWTAHNPSLPRERGASYGGLAPPPWVGGGRATWECSDALAGMGLPRSSSARAPAS
jgi:hypothetical protein